MRTIILVLSMTALAADWPRFRGINGAGVGEAAPTKWTDKENRLWTVDLPGKGNGSPIIAKGKIFLQCAAADGAKRSLVCLDAVTGKELWAKHQTGAFAKTHAKNSLASSTPATDGERVFCCFWDGAKVALVAYDFSGKELWKEELGAFKSDHGAGMSPMVHAGKVFVNYDQEGTSAILAHDAITGKKAWSQERKSFRACYSTPIVRDLPGGKSEIIVLSTAGVAAYAPADGHINWDSPFTWNGQALRSVASPVLAGDIVIALTGDGGGARYCCGIEPGSAPKRVWETHSTKLTPYVPCPVVKGEHLYWLTDQGILQCVDPKKGKAVWTEQIFSAAVSASPIFVGDVLLMIDEKGKAIAGKVDATGFEKVSESQVGAQVIATPAVAEGRLYIRGGTKLLCIGAKPNADPKTLDKKSNDKNLLGFPTKVGTEWIYESGDTTQKRVITKSETKDDITVIHIDKLSVEGKLIETTKMMIKPDGVYQIFPDHKQNDEQVLLINSPVKVNEEWNHLITGDKIYYEEKGARKVYGPEKTVTPSGNYQAYRIETVVMAWKSNIRLKALVYNYWIAPGIGIIKEFDDRNERQKIDLTLKKFTPGK